MTAPTATKNLIANGFAKAPFVMPAEQLRTLQEHVDRLFEREPRPFAEYQADKAKDVYGTVLYRDTTWSIVLDIPGADPVIDGILESLLTNPIIQGTLRETLGSGYKLWQANIRRAEPGGAELTLHQDAPGETGLSILISDTPRGGATAFLRRSHLWPVTVRDLGISISPHRFSRFLCGAEGDAGGVYFFFNRTWHGRFPADSPATALMMSFFPVGAVYPLHRAPPAVLSKLPPELRRLLDPDDGVEPLGDGNRVRVVGTVPVRSSRLGSILTGNVPYSRMSPVPIIKAYSRLKELVRASR